MNGKYTDFNEQVALGEQLCVKLKHIYYPDALWFESYRAIANKLTNLKSKARKVLAHLEEIEILKTLRGFTETDIQEFMYD